MSEGQYARPPWAEDVMRDAARNLTTISVYANKEWLREADDDTIALLIAPAAIQAALATRDKLRRNHNQKESDRD